MALGREMEDGVDAIFFEYPFDEGTLADVPSLEEVATPPAGGLDRGEILGISRVAERVQIDDPAVETRPTQEIVYEIRSYETGSAGDENVREFPHVLSFW
jgi:hypothetical protein